MVRFRGSDYKWKWDSITHDMFGAISRAGGYPSIPKWPPRGGACIPGGNSAVSARYRAANPGTGAFSLHRAIGCINWGRNRPGWRCRPSAGCQGEGRISRAETVQLVAGLGLGSLIWMVNDFPDGQGALTKR